MMDFNEFVKGLMEGMNVLLPEYKLKIFKKKRNGQKFVGIAIINELENFFPVVYLESYYKKYRNGGSIEELAKQIVDDYHNSKEKMELVQKGSMLLGDYEAVKNRICYKLIETASNGEMLEGLVSVPFLNLSLVFYIALDNFATALVGKQMQEVWKVSDEEIFRQAALNTPNLCPAVFLPAIGNDITTSDQNGETIYILTNGERYLGAAVIFYPDILEQISQFYGDKDFYILPINVNEVLIIPRSSADDVRMQALYCEKMKTFPRDEEFLSEKYYIYDAKKKKIEMVRED